MAIPQRKQEIATSVFAESLNLLAVMTKNEEDIGKYRELSKGFISENFKQAEALGAKSIVLFCSACEPDYNNYKNTTGLNIIPYTELLDRSLQKGRLDTEIDYYGDVIDLGAELPMSRSIRNLRSGC